MSLKKLVTIFKNYKQYEIDKSKKNSLDLILFEVTPSASLESRIAWILKLVLWIRSTDLFEITSQKTPLTKLKYFLMVLDRNESTKKKVSLVLRKTLLQLRASDFFCEVGLPSQLSLFGEFFDKIIANILPKKPISNQLSEFMINLFPELNDVLWLKSIDEGTLNQLLTLFKDEENLFLDLESDIEDSLIYLTSQVVASGLGPGIRKRIPHKTMKTLPFFYLSSKLNLYLDAKKEKSNPELTTQIMLEFSDLLKECQVTILEVYKHLDEYGVSTHLVFQLERMKLFINRILSLLEILSFGHLENTKISSFIAELVEQNLSQRSPLKLLSNNITLLAQKIIETNSKTGEHYIAKNRHEYWAMIIRAMRGGFFTAFTVFIKNLLNYLPFTSFFQGAFATLNYAGSFLLIQFTGGTLATKQPAATASALAAKLGATEKREEIESLTDEIIAITNSQVAAVVGNILAVVPTVIIVNLIFFSLTNKPIFTKATALYTLYSTDVFGPTIIYATFTGFLLWLSSFFSGWAGNWCSFHQISQLIRDNKKFQKVLTKEGANKLSTFLEREITGIAGSLSLGFLLGFFPEFLKFIGIPLEVRHVTLSTGALTAAISTLGIDALKTTEFLRASLGIFLIGSLNLGVSFFLALAVAFRAKKISPHKKILIYRSVLERFYKAPFSFFIPGLNFKKNQ